MISNDHRKAVTEPLLRVRFRNWLLSLNDAQVAALAENWDNIMNDAAGERIGSWVIAQQTLDALKEMS